MVLVLTNSLDATADFLVPILEAADIDVVRFDTDDLVPRLKSSYEIGDAGIRWNNRKISPNDIEHSWYRRPDRLKSPLFGGSPEGNYARLEWTEFVECFLAQIPQSQWMNHPARNVAASRKLQQLTLAAEIMTAASNTRSATLLVLRLHSSRTRVLPLRARKRISMSQRPLYRATMSSGLNCSLQRSVILVINDVVVDHYQKVGSWIIALVGSLPTRLPFKTSKNLRFNA